MARIAIACSILLVVGIALVAVPGRAQLASLVGPDKEAILYHDIDISEMITAKQYHDIVGHYTRMDVVSLNLCQDKDTPVRITGKTNAAGTSETETSDLQQQIEALKINQQQIMQALARFTELVGKAGQ